MRTTTRTYYTKARVDLRVARYWPVKLAAYTCTSWWSACHSRFSSTSTTQHSSYRVDKSFHFFSVDWRRWVITVNSCPIQPCPLALNKLFRSNLVRISHVGSLD